MRPKKSTRASKKVKRPNSPKGENLTATAEGEGVGRLEIPRKRKADEDLEIMTSNSLSITNFGGNEEDEVATSLKDRQFISDMMKLTLSKDPERTLVELMKNYSFDFPRVQDLLSENRLPISLSKVRYLDIARRVGLNPEKCGNDIPTFDTFRARLPDDIVCGIVEDVEIFAKQYNILGHHKNEEARACYLSSYFNRIISVFSGLILNTPETLIEGNITRKGRIEYQFRIFGGITIVFMEVKLRTGSVSELLNFMAQVIAELDACSLMNYKQGFEIPVLGILCAGGNLSFYRYTNSKGPENYSPQFAIGRFPDGATIISMNERVVMDRRAIDTKEEVRNLRSICEAFYYAFLEAFGHSLDAFWNRSVKNGTKDGKERESTVEWLKARDESRAAITAATIAWEEFNKGELENSEKLAVTAVESLINCVQCPLFDRVSAFPGFTKDMVRGS